MIHQGLLHAAAHCVGAVLGLDDGDGDVVLVVEDAVGPFLASALAHVALDNDPALGQGHFLAHLGMNIPAGLFEGGDDLLGADIPLGKDFVVHQVLLKSSGSSWAVLCPTSNPAVI